MPGQVLRKVDAAYSGKAMVNTLLLDDESIDRTKILRLARRSKLPLNIVEAPSIAAMRNAISEKAFDLFLVDYQLPEGNGFEAVDLIRTQPDNKDAALIMITGHEETDMIVAAFRRGCNDLISKNNLSAELLRERVTAALIPTPRLSVRSLFEDEKLHRHLRDAVKDKHVRDEITEGFRRVVRQATHKREKTEHDEKMQSFLRDFLNEDEFRFK